MITIINTKKIANNLFFDFLKNEFPKYVKEELKTDLTLKFSNNGYVIEISVPPSAENLFTIAINDQEIVLSQVAADNGHNKANKLLSKLESFIRAMLV